MSANMSEIRLSLQLGHLETLRRHAPATAQADIAGRMESVVEKIADNRRAVARQGDTGPHGLVTNVHGESAKLRRRLDTRAPKFTATRVESVAR